MNYGQMGGTGFPYTETGTEPGKKPYQGYGYPYGGPFGQYGAYGSTGFGSYPGGSSNPWESRIASLINKFNNPYGQQYGQLVGNAMGEANKDWSAEMAKLAREGVDKAQAAAGMSLNSRGMGELMAAPDVAADWAKNRSDALLQSKISASQMKQQALQGAGQIVQGASGNELDWIVQQLQGMLGAGGMNQNWMQMLLPLYEKLGMFGGGAGGGVNAYVGGPRVQQSGI